MAAAARPVGGGGCSRDLFVEHAGLRLTVGERGEGGVVLMLDHLHPIDHVQGGGTAGRGAAIALTAGDRHGDRLDDRDEIAKSDDGVGRLGQDDLEPGHVLQYLVA